MAQERRRLRVTGTVQGVGFRPFVYRLAVAYGLAGSVRNLGDAGVEIYLEGEPGGLAQFLDRLRNDLPPLARVETISWETIEPIGESAFVIATSGEEEGASGSIPPDTAICERCVEEVLGDSRFHGYWATSCTDCGPRFTVIVGLPYDRPRTSMVEFPMCADCQAEYTAPHDRRYHAQTTACPVCGPTLSFDGSPDRAVERAIAALDEGSIVAIKGIGGTHLACDAASEVAVATLRERLGRVSQPLAVMTAEASLDRWAILSDEERSLLRGPARPIVVVEKRVGALPDVISPGLHSIGVMLPYTGLHHLLLDGSGRVLVMTSANLPGRPMWIHNSEILDRLSDVADHFLLHDRRIVARCDDSVLRRSGGKSVFLRRSRGHVPRPFSIDLGGATILGLGPESDLTFSFYFDGALTSSQHIGTVDDLETYDFLDEAIDHLQHLIGAPAPDVVACDLHPRFLTSERARHIGEALGVDVVPVQHHAAHLVSVMGEHGLESAVGIILDGYGYGLDGAAWGGEVLVGRERRIQRAGSLRPVRLPGGDQAARFPMRVAAALLAAGELPLERLERMLICRGVPPSEVGVLLAQIGRGINAPWTTSAGRFLDAVSAWLGLCRERTYEGEPAMRLEAAAHHGKPVTVEPTVRCVDGRWEWDTAGAFLSLMELAESESVETVAATAQAMLAEGVARMAIETAQEREIESVVFSGGVAYNDAIARRIRRAVEQAGRIYHTNEATPCGDGGISFGQAIYAGQRWTFA